MYIMKVENMAASCWSDAGPLILITNWKVQIATQTLYSEIGHKYWQKVEDINFEIWGCNTNNMSAYILAG